MSTPADMTRPVVGRALTGLMIVLAVIGAVAFLSAVTNGPADRAWQAYLVNLLVWLGVAQGAIVVSASFYLTQARWAGPAQYRLAESFTPFLVVGFILFWGLYFGRALIFPWVAHPVAQKAAWLNTPFLFARDGGSLAVMTLLSLWFVRVSRGESACSWASHSRNITMPPPAIRRLAPTIALVFAAVYSLIGFDLVMSLAPVWRSTLFGAYFFAGSYWSGIVAMALTAVLLRRRLGAGNVFAEPEVLHDLGKLVFAFSVFWVYLLFAQYIVIWYGDIPVETFFVVQRVHHMPWTPLSWIALGLIWVVPFVVLLGARPKRTPAILGIVSLGGIVGIFIERYVLVVPSLSLNLVPFGGIELLITLGFIGIFVLSALPGLNRIAAAAARAERGESDEAA